MSLEEGTESGKSLRERLEETIAENNATKAELHSYKVRDVLATKGFRFVEAEELTGVPLDQVETKAQQLQDQRVKTQHTLLKDALSKQGVPEDELDAMVTDLLTERQAASPEAQATTRAHEVGRTEGALVPREDPNKLHGFDALEAHFAKQKN